MKKTLVLTIVLISTVLITGCEAQQPETIVPVVPAMEETKTETSSVNNDKKQIEDSKPTQESNPLDHSPNYNSKKDTKTNQIEKKQTAVSNTQNHEENLFSTLRCQLIDNPFINKGSKTMDFNDLYLNCSDQDYFIKFCESTLTQEELIGHLGKTIEVEVEIREGNWDICKNDPEYAQSRMGTYVIIKKIIN